ncbi:hypothetical protein BATDEDRAFT_87388 [Batrachochytrium dendrobatidis JAM81]|uniref:AMP-dependent synthetase/ligase domain-containing protein n=1 Tax=Batrachochytrium dendrobatidis (strain JAM81 / FGSC 10211) TaxID=684364 RepID=F4NZH6_BATDJ|nr:uncharacterized protein BATDEDRAFT_87388 [Batrachochytrium dendrobatidis JAM81]EGF81132.1 hypothetical protein BATDEDRAFT_87388 [Batrachochytrium dendrobatidis JAM81]|eukprot:XP_006678096.1 hypothetical protein BATDEDRAFT_87388 [Batrachochytrium dendrobatidis JAM81]
MSLLRMQTFHRLLVNTTQKSPSPTLLKHLDIRSRFPSVWRSSASTLRYQPLSTIFCQQVSFPDIGLFRTAVSNISKIAIAIPSNNNTSNSSKTEAHSTCEQFSYGDLLHDTVIIQSLLLYANKKTRSKISDLKEQRVAYLMPRGYDYVKCMSGIWAAGGIAVPLCSSHPVQELSYTIQDSGAEIVLYHSTFNDRITDLKRQLPNIQWISSNELTLYQKPKAIDVELQDFDMSRGAMLIYTRHGIINALLCALWSGATCEFTADSKFNAKDIWQRWECSQRDLTLFMAVPTIYAKLAASFEEMSVEKQNECAQICKQFRVMVSGSSALPTSLFQQWEKITDHRLLERYGMTEVGMALGNPLEGPRIPGEVGNVLPGVQIMLQSPSTSADITHIPDEPGSLLIRGPQVFSRYWNKPDTTLESFVEPGHWFKTGDVACRTQTGTFKILGRASMDIIKTGGFKVSALDIERELYDHPDIEEVAVVGVPDPEWGERVGAIVVQKNKTRTITLDCLRSWLTSRLASYKIPTKLVFIEEIPRNTMGKVDKKQLIKLFSTE